MRWSLSIKEYLIFETSSTQAVDMLYAGSLAGVSKIENLWDSAAAGKVFVIADDDSYYYSEDTDTELRVHSASSNGLLYTVAFPYFPVAGSVESHGEFVFANADGTRVYAIVEADESAMLEDEYGVIVFTGL